MIKQTKYNTFTTKEGNIIWAAAMTLCWTNFLEHITKNEKLKLQGLQHSKIVYNFNHPSFSKKDIHQSCYYVKSGFGSKTIQIINEQMKQKFPNKTFSDLNYQMNSDDIISYAYLAKGLQFRQRFQINQNGLQFKSREVDENGKSIIKIKQVQSFYGKQDYEIQQVKIVYHQSNYQFCCAIKGKTNKNGISDTLFVLRTDKENMTIDEVINQVMKVGDVQKLDCLQYEKFQMPIIDFDQSNQYSQLMGRAFQNHSIYGKRLAIMKENIKLRIDHKGAKLQNQAEMIINQCAISSYKKFIVDGPFWIVMREQHHHPYLCVKINNLKENLADLVIEFQEWNQNTNQKK